MINIIIVDDDKIICDAIKQIINQNEEYNVLDVGYSYEDALRLYYEHKPDITLLDIRLGDKTGIDVATKILSDYPGAKIIFLSTFSEDEYILKAINMGAKGYIIKNTDGEETRYDFQYVNKRGYKTTMEGLSYKFNPVFWNYAKLISGTLRHGMPINNVVDLVTSLQLDNDTINSWKAGVARALKKYIPDGTLADLAVCGSCGSNEVVYQEGCLTCVACGSSKCG